jgi:hypothetical protein
MEDDLGRLLAEHAVTTEHEPVEVLTGRVVLVITDDDRPGHLVLTGRQHDDLVLLLAGGVDRGLDGIGVVGHPVGDCAELLRGQDRGPVGVLRVRRRRFRVCLGRAGGEKAEAGCSGGDHPAPIEVEIVVSHRGSCRWIGLISYGPRRC